MAARHFLLLTCSILLAVNFLSAQQSGAGAINLPGTSDIDFKQAALLLHNQPGIGNVIPRISKDAESPAILFYTFSSENTRMTAMQALVSAGFAPVVAGSNIPADFPQPGSATSKTERIQFAESKSNWIANNPDLYEQMQVPVMTVIPQAEFDSMPQVKQQHVLDNPDLYTIE